MKQGFLGLPKLARLIVLFVGCWAPLTTAKTARAQPAAAPVGNSTASGDVLLDSAITQLRRHATVSAQLNLKASLLGQHLQGTGRYLQKGKGSEQQVRLEISIPTGDAETVMINVSNGRHWWRYRSDPRGEPRLNVIDLTMLRAAIADARARGTGSINDDLARGGMLQLLTRLQQNFQFASATTTGQGESTAWVTRGLWRYQQLQRVVGTADSETSAKASAQLNRRLPQEVVVHLHKATLFPQRIEYLGAYPPAKPGANPAAVPQQKRPTLALIELTRININTALDDENFQRPFEMEEHDITARYLKDLGIGKASQE